MARVLVAGKYQLVKKIGAGSFGKIFWGVTPPRPPIGGCIQTESPDTSVEGVRACEAAETPLAVKIMSIQHSALHNNEVAIYEKIREIKYVPTIYSSGIEGKFNYIVMDLLEQSVEELFINYGNQLPLKVVIHLALQMLNIVEQIHACGIIHRDLKPANFLLKTNSQQISELYLIDFGLGKCFLDEKQRHCTIKTNETIVGTTRYMSVNTHHGLTASRRDDLESLGYIMLFLYHGKLSWQNQESVERVAELKQKLDWHKNSIGEFFLFVLYCRNLDFAEKPNYDYLRGLLTNLNKL
jgi:serine/threonine protein kinase